MRGVCQLCVRNIGPFDGIETVKGLFCYKCIKWVHELADETRALRDNPNWRADQDATE